LEIDSHIGQFVDAVQRNCDIADAKYAGDDALCVYLMKMRDYYRWSENQPLNQPVDRSTLGEWVSIKEALWDELEEHPLASVPLCGASYSCFDIESINEALTPYGLVYGAGLGRRGRPTFFVGELESIDQAGQQKILISGKELARCVSAPPAMSRECQIHVRRDALRRYLSSMVEEWSWKKIQNTMAEIVSHYGFDEDPEIALDSMVDHEVENLVLHEIGEQVAGELIGERWQEMISSLSNPVIELKARAVRDNLADCVTALPAFLALEDRPSLDFYYANMTPLRRELFPSFCQAYRDGRSTGDFSRLAAVIRSGQRHWLHIGRRLVSGTSRSDQMRAGELLDDCAL